MLSNGGEGVLLSKVIICNH